MINISNTRSQVKQAIRELFAPIEYAAYGMPHVLNNENYHNIQIYETATSTPFNSPADISRYVLDRLQGISVKSEFLNSPQGKGPLTINIILKDNLNTSVINRLISDLSEHNIANPRKQISYEKQLSKALSTPRAIAVVFKFTDPTSVKTMPQYLIIADRSGTRNQDDNSYLTRYLTLAIAVSADLMVSGNFNDHDVLPNPVEYYKRFYTSDIDTAVRTSPIRDTYLPLKEYYQDVVYSKSVEKLLKFIKPDKEPALMDMIQRTERQLESLYAQLRDETNKKKRLEDDLLAFRYSPQVDDNLTQSLKRIAKVADLNENDINLGSSQIIIKLKSHDVAVDQEAFKLIQKSNRESDYRSLNDSYKALLQAIFIDQTYRLPIVGQLRVMTSGEHSVEKIGANIHMGHMTNPHYELHACMGDSKPLLQKAMMSQDAVNWLLLAKTAVGNINVTDGTVWAKFVRKLADRNYDDALIYNRETNEAIKIKDWLTQYKTEQKAAKDRELAQAEKIIRDSLVVEVAPEPTPTPITAIIWDAMETNVPQPQPVPTFTTVGATRRGTTADPFDLPENTEPRPVRPTRDVIG